MDALTSEEIHAIIITTLLNANPNHNETALITAAKNGHFEEAKRLIEKSKSNIMIININNLLHATPSLNINTVFHTYNETALMLAAKSGHLEVAKLLIETRGRHNYCQHYRAFCLILRSAVQ